MREYNIARKAKQHFRTPNASRLFKNSIVISRSVWSPKLLLRFDALLYSLIVDNLNFTTWFQIDLTLSHYLHSRLNTFDTNPFTYSMPCYNWNIIYSIIRFKYVNITTFLTDLNGLRRNYRNIFFCFKVKYR